MDTKVISLHATAPKAGQGGYAYPRPSTGSASSVTKGAASTTKVNVKIKSAKGRGNSSRGGSAR
jgi:hypothetical protein